jgi:hypothetical protein
MGRVLPAILAGNQGWGVIFSTHLLPSHYALASSSIRRKVPCPTREEYE